MNHGIAVLGSPWGHKGFLDSSVGKESACNAGDPSSIPGLGRSAGEGIGYPLQYSYAFLVAQLVKNPPAMWETWVDPWVGKVSWRRERLSTPVFWPGEFHDLYGCKEADTTLSLSLFYHIGTLAPLGRKTFHSSCYFQYLSQCLTHSHCSIHFCRRKKERISRNRTYFNT